MQIQHLDQSVYTFINQQLPAAVGYQCYNVFYLAECLGLKSYDQTFVDLVAIDDGVEMDTIRDLFIEKVKRLAQECIEEHRITIDRDAVVLLDEYIEIVHFLVLVQSLEDPDVIMPRLYGLGTPRAIFTDVLSTLSHMPKWRAMEIIEAVDASLIASMQALFKDRVQAQPQQDTNHHYQLGVQVLEQFMADSECLGLTLYRQGYCRLTWKVLENLCTVKFQEHFSKQYQNSVALCAVDFVSLALICKDTYQTPLLHLSKLMPLYLDSSEAVSKVHTVALAILSDYQTLKDGVMQQQAAQMNHDQV